MALILLCAAAYSHAADANPDGAGSLPEMVLIPAGGFLMGSPATAQPPYPPVETPQHKVELDAYFMDKYEVTNQSFAEFLNAKNTGPEFELERPKWVVIRNDLRTEEKKDWWPAEIELEQGRYEAGTGFEKYPVISVSWHAADAYCRWRGKRLPTEAEWEKAARGGLEGKDYPWGDPLPTVGIIFKRIWKNNALPAPVEQVGNYYPNGLGIFDAAGNASEWCSDWYDASYYAKSPVKAPKGPDSGFSKVIRGGSWASKADTVRVAFRNYGLPTALMSGVGFRCARDETR